MNIWKKIFGEDSKPLKLDSLPPPKKRVTSKYWQRRGDSKPLKLDSLPKTNTPSEEETTTRVTSKYWQCQGCGAIFTKDEGRRQMNEMFLSTGAGVIGGETCQICGTRHEASDIFRGKYDMRSPDSLVTHAIEDRADTIWDNVARVWKYRGQELRGSLLFESLDTPRPSNVRHDRAHDGKILSSTLTVDRYHIEHADATEVGELLDSVAKQICGSGSFQPCNLIFVGYDDDPRTICEIQEIRRWCAAAWKRAPALMPLLEQNITALSRMFLFCLLPVTVTKRQNGRAYFKGPTKEYANLVEKTVNSAHEFLLSCGYSSSDADNYLAEWLKSLLDM